MSFAMQAMIKMFDPVLTWAARKYQAAVATELKKYGLRYEDLYDPQLNMVSSALQSLFHCSALYFAYAFELFELL